MKIIESETLQVQTENNKNKIKNIFVFIGTYWEHYASQFKTNAALKTLAWLPAKEDRLWHKPDALYADYSRYLFYTQALFLDIESQQKYRDFIEHLGIGLAPGCDLVVKHLLACSDSGIQLNHAISIYDFLKNQLNKNVEGVDKLIDRRCIYSASGAYLLPSDCFWADHPFGCYKYKLSHDFRSFTGLFHKLGVKEEPSSKDAISVMREISKRFSSGISIDDGTNQVIRNCWKFIEEKDDLDDDTWREIITSGLIPYQFQRFDFLPFYSEGIL